MGGVGDGNGGADSGNDMDGGCRGGDVEVVAVVSGLTVMGMLTVVMVSQVV